MYLCSFVCILTSYNTLANVLPYSVGDVDYYYRHSQCTLNIVYVSGCMSTLSWYIYCVLFSLTWFAAGTSWSNSPQLH